MNADFTLTPYRFSSNPAAMIAFLEALGLSREIDTSRGSFAVLRAAAGKVGVHAAAGSETHATAAETQLVFEVPTAQDAERVLTAQGLHVDVWDEAYGMQAAVRDPFGAGIWLNETMKDLHGYDAHDGQPASDIMVSVVRYSPDFDADERFFAHLGYRAHAERHPGWTPLSSTDGGVLGLHKPGERPVTRELPGSPVGDVSVCDLGFTTTARLEAVRDRLLAAGYASGIVSDHHLQFVQVMDPDGCTIQIHPAD